MEAIILTRQQFDNITSKLDDLKKIVLNQPNSNQEDSIIDNAHFIKLMSISKRTAQTWRDHGKIGFSQVGNKIYYKLSDVNELLAGNYNPKF